MKHKTLIGISILPLIILIPIAFSLTYNEKLTNPSMTDNSYSIAVSNFIKEKCGNCKDVIIIGDDFVVPHYRRDIPTLEKKWFFWTEKDIKNIYTDIPYIKKSMLYLSDYKEIFKNTDIVAKEGKYEGKDVLFILPDDITTEQREQINRLRKAFDDKGYKPDYSEKSGTDTFCLDERWFADVKGKTLIIIGTEENNNAFKCMPFVAGNANRDSAFMQPNIWDTDEYALVINTNNPDIIGALADMVETGEITELKSESAYFFKVGVTYAGYAALGVGVGSLVVFSGGTAAPGAILAAGVALDWIADSGDVADTCVVNPEGVGWCGGTIALAALPFVPSKVVKKPLKGFADAVSNSELKKLLEPYKELLEKQLPKIKKAFGKIPFENGVKTVEVNIHVAQGTDYLVKKSGKSAEEALTNYKRQFANTQRGKTHAVKTITKLGKYSDEFFETNSFVRYSDTDTRIFRGDNRNPTDIISNDEGFKAYGNSLDYEKYVHENIPSRFIGASKSPKGAMEAMISTGNAQRGGGSWMYVTDPRARNFIDDLETLPNPSSQRLIEEGVIAIDKIDVDDIVGAVYTKEGTGEIIETFVNPNYKGKLNLKNINYEVG
jgi:hypothetical protein